MLQKSNLYTPLLGFGERTLSGSASFILSSVQIWQHTLPTAVCQKPHLQAFVSLLVLLYPNSTTPSESLIDFYRTDCSDGSSCLPWTTDRRPRKREVFESNVPDPFKPGFKGRKPNSASITPGTSEFDVTTCSKRVVTGPECLE